MSITVVAEKPSVARDLARVLGATHRAEGYLEGNGYRVTWAIGHLVALAEPGDMRPEWKKWRRDLLPMFPGEWPLQVLEQTRGQFEVVRRLLTDRECERVVCATDAGREGELIYRLIHEAAKCRKPVQRLWISSLTDAAIHQGFQQLKDARAYDGLADAARGRSRADWLVGMNLSRAYGLSLDAQVSVGRVQTPTLAMLVERELAIRAFVSEPYQEVVATFSPAPNAHYQGTWIRPDRTLTLTQRKRLSDPAAAAAIVARVSLGDARIALVTRETKRMPPPQLYDLTELQRHANRLFGFTAQRTLEIAQALYETHKVLSYPRTDSRHLSTSVAATLPSIVAAIRGPYEALLAPGTGQHPLGKRHVDDAQVTDHHAILPTDVPAGRLDGDERRIYDLVCRRLLQAWHGDFVWGATTVLTEVHTPGIVDQFYTAGTAIEDMGWKVLDLGGGRKVPKRKADKGEHDEDDEGENTLPAGLAAGQDQRVLDVRAVDKKTVPPPRLTDATLLGAMETAGRTLDDRELSRAMKDSGLGTPATRATIIETLVQRAYVERQGKALAATDKGIGLIAVVDPMVKSPVMTGQWEARLQEIARGEGALSDFVAGIEQYVRDVIGRVPEVLDTALRGADAPRASGSAPASAAQPSARTKSTSPARPLYAEPTPAPTPYTPTPGEPLPALLQRVFGFGQFRPHQEAVCRAAADGADVLLVMPTGAGKSLCYQLPGLARGGTTLVVSPLIALIEDQVTKLRALGLNAARIHSGLSRQASRDVCREYLDGTLDFLFIAPERLGVPGFPEMLAKRIPALVAIDEAHCISQWGHDFRPDYRLLGQRLPLLRPAPIVAVTATATPVVQRDIVTQLGLGAPRAFIHGFRRTNLAIEVRECAPKERIALAVKLLSGPGRLPAIVYAPTRKRADEVARELSRHIRCSAYHAGMTADAREQVQTAFLSGRLDLVVATVAFGMGVDKADVRTVVHLALPGSVEGYYQEIGRAGRDGQESRAILLHSWADRHTLQFFHDRDYPEPEVLQRTFDALSARPITKETVRRKSKVDAETLDKVLEKLWMAGAAIVTPDEDVSRGQDGWQPAYAAQRDQRAQQVVLMGRFTEAHGCRMLHLVRHFGDTEDSGTPCGICDMCASDRTLVNTSRAATADERRDLVRILDVLRDQDHQSTGRVCKQLFGDGQPARKRFEALLVGLARAGMLTLTDDVFEKDGKPIQFQRAALTPAGRGVTIVELLPNVSLPTEAAPAKRGGAAPKRGATSKRTRGAQSAAPATPRVRHEVTPSPLANALRTWRLAEARRRRVPAFRIFSDRVLDAIATAAPKSDSALLAVSGVGPKLVETVGLEVVAICRGF